MPINAVLFDTGFAIALENRAGPYHERAKQEDRRLLAAGTEPVLHWGIVLEIGDGDARLGRRSKGIAFLERFETESGYRVEPITEVLYQEAIDLYLSRPDKEWGLTDCVSFVLMRREGIAEALLPMSISGKRDSPRCCWNRSRRPDERAGW